MNFPVKETGLRKQLTELTDKHDSLAKEVENELNRIMYQIRTQNEVLNAVVRLVGNDEVMSMMGTIRDEQRKAMEDQQKKTVEDLKEKGILVQQETVDNNSVMVTKEIYPDGKVLREQYRISAVQEDARPLFIGKKVGEVIDYRGIKVELAEIYYFDQARADEVLKQEEQAANTGS